MLKHLVNTANRYKRIEFWAFSTIFAFAICYFIWKGLDVQSAIQHVKNKRAFDEAGVPYDYYENFFIPQLVRYICIFGAFLYLNFIAIPRLLSNKEPFWTALRIVLLYIFTSFMFGATNVLLDAYVYQIQSIEATLLQLYGSGFLYGGFWFVVFGFYAVSKYAIVFMLDKASQAQSTNTFVRKEGVIAFLVWVGVLLLMIITNMISLFTLLWIVLIPSAIMFYLLSFYRLIPESLSKPAAFMSYFWKMSLILAALFLPVAAFVWVLLHDGPPSVMLSIFNTVFQLLVTMPVSWHLYKRYAKGNEEINTLRRELGQSNANFDFLRSQINPHFLFNALNTLYGTAIEEKSERTSEGIQKLGDMMRFMLQENMQEKIALSREIEYMNNYISLQKLRTATNDSIRIEADVQEDVHGFEIAPMLLIPFIENAFKHGISFREASHIKISLACKGNTLVFTVNNSKHQRLQNDPEKYNTGIGMNNVQQRLQLLYPGKHELVLNETEKEFSIRLSIQLI